MKYIFKGKRLLSIILLLSFLISILGCGDNTISENYYFDNEGKLLKKTGPDPKQKISLKYDNEGLPVEISYPDNNVSFSYDRNKNRTKMKDNSGTTEYYYDESDRLICLISRRNADQLILIDYDSMGNTCLMAILNLSSMKKDLQLSKYAEKLEAKENNEDEQWKIRQRIIQELIGHIKSDSGSIPKETFEYLVLYEYDIIGNPVRIAFPSGEINYTFHPLKGQVVRLLPNGVKTIYTYSPDNLLISIRHENSEGKLISQYGYEYDAMGRTTKVFEKNTAGEKTYTYSWDPRGYLAGLQLPDGREIKYEYDSMGNRITEKEGSKSTKYEYDGFGRLVSDGSVRYRWDSNGNMGELRGKKSNYRIKYDSRNLPLMIKTKSGTTNYEWDGDGKLVSMGQGDKIHYQISNPLFSGDYVLEEFDGDSKPSASYIYGTGLISRVDNTGSMQFYLEDGFSSIRHVVDQKGDAFCNIGYSPFAEPITNQDVPTFRMAGERYLPEIKSYLIQGRIYDPRTARYFSPDRDAGNLLMSDSFNKYTHGSNGTEYFRAPRCHQTQLDRIQYWEHISASDYMYQHIGSFYDDIAKYHYMHGNNLKADLWLALGTFPVVANMPPLSPVVKNIGKALDPQLSGDQRVLSGFKAGGHLLLCFSSSIIEGLKWVSRFKLPGCLAGQPGRYKLVDDSIKLLNVADAADKVNTALSWGNYAVDNADETIFSSKFLQSRNPVPPLQFSFSNAAKQLGGIKLSCSGEFTCDVGDITGAVYDRKKKCLVLVGDNNLAVPGIGMEDLAVAIKLVYSDREAEFTLDPYDPKNPRGPWLKAVYIPNGILAGTEFGKALFEADWLLKQYSMGIFIDENAKGPQKIDINNEGRPFISEANIIGIHPRKCLVPGFKSSMDISFETAGSGNRKAEKWSRFWIISDVMKMQKTEDSIYFDVARMKVKTKKIIPDPESPQGFRDVETEEDPIANKFAALFTEHYDEIAKEAPVFGRLKQLAKAIALAKWIKKNNVEVDLKWAEEVANRRVPTVSRINSLSVEWEKIKVTRTPIQNGVRTATSTRSVHLFGGVNLTVKPDYLKDSGKAMDLQKSVLAGMKKRNNPSFTLVYGDKPMRASVLPINENGLKEWKTRKPEVNGIAYESDGKGNIGTGTDMDGNSLKFSYDNGQKLNKIDINFIDGRKDVITGTPSGTEWSGRTPDGKTFKYVYGKSGKLQEVLIDGRSLGKCNYDPESREFVTRFPDRTDVYKLDQKGNVRNYEISTGIRGGSLKGKNQTLRVEFNKNGEPSKISGSGISPMKLSYDKNSSSPGKIESPLLKTECVYDSRQRLTGVKNSAGDSISIKYEGDELEEIKITCRGETIDYSFDKGNLVKKSGALTGSDKYEYVKGKLLKLITGEKGITIYEYDDSGRLTGIKFPDKSRTEYIQKERSPGSSRSKLPSSQYIIQMKRHPGSPGKNVHSYIFPGDRITYLFYTKEHVSYSFSLFVREGDFSS